MDMTGGGKMLNRRSVVRMADMESLIGDTIDRVANLDERTERMEAHIVLIPEVKLMLTSMTSVMNLMAQSAESWATTYKKSEERQERLEIRYEAVVQTAAGKKQVPLYLMVLILVMFSAYVLVDKMKESSLNLDIPWIGIHITQEKK